MKITTLLLFLVAFSSSIIAQKKSNDATQKWMKGWTNFNPNATVYPEIDEVLPQIIDFDITLDSDTVYKLSGNVYVTENATLTIPAGTIIRCDTKNPASLVVTRGAKLIAKGTKTAPILFTSNKAAHSRNSGDWGGIIIIGNAPINTPAGSGIIEGNFNPKYSLFGGNNSDEETVVLSYVRIEFPGKKINASKELNGLTLYAVGRNSIINNVMVSYSADDSFEWFGGQTNFNNLVSLKAKDDDFDITMGSQGVLNNITAIRHPYISDTSGSYAIEIDGYDKNSSFLTATSLSTITITNATLINLADHSNFQHTAAAISSKNMAKLHIKDSRISGFSNVVKFDKSYTSFSGLTQSFSLENSLFNVHGKAVSATFELNPKTQNLLKYNRFTSEFKSVSELFIAPLSEKKPKFTLRNPLDNYTVMQ